MQMMIMMTFHTYTQTRFRAESPEVIFNDKQSGARALRYGGQWRTEVGQTFYFCRFLGF